MQPPSVSQPCSVQPIIPCFIISVYSFLIPFLHAFHVSDIRLFHVLRPRSLFHSTLHCIPLVLFLFPLLFPTLCPFPMNPACSLLGSSSPAQVGPLSPALSFCLFVHIPVPDSVPPRVSCVRYSFVSCSPSPIPVPFHFASHSSCSISVSLIVSDPMPFSHDPDMFSWILICSELHVCFLSLKST